MRLDDGGYCDWVVQQYGDSNKPGQNCEMWNNDPDVDEDYADYEYDAH